MDFVKKELRPQDRHLLHQIHALALKIEQESTDQNFNEKSLLDLNALLCELQFSENQELTRLSEIPDHLHPKMTLQHFSNFIVPIERLIDRNIRDDEFLVTTQDRPFALDKDQAGSTSILKRRDLYFVLDHIRSAFNVGSIFRLADSVGAQKVFLCGYTPSPQQKALQKTALGSVEFVESESNPKTEQVIEGLRKNGVFIIGLETSQNSKNLFSGTLLGPTAFVVGNERFGLDRKTLEMCDEVRSIPMFGVKNSLNVSNSLSIAAYEWSRQNP